MAMTTDAVTFEWEQPTTEAAWEAATPPPEADELERICRGALAEAGADHVRVIFRRDGLRWRVLAETPSHDGREAHGPTQAVVQALRSAGIKAEPGFPADPHEPKLPVNPVE